MNQALPDCCFVEDTAVVLDELAVLASMGAASRRPEVAGMEPVIRRYRPVCPIQLPATLDGGDVVRVGRTILVGLSSRTNAAGVNALASIVAPHGYRVIAVPVRGCLHLKSACTALPDGRLLVNPSWLELAALREYHCVPVPETEPDAADSLSLGRTVCLPTAFPRTAERVTQLGFDVRTVDLSEFAKAEGGITCLSLVFEH
jgi:dimethylargininase